MCGNDHDGLNFNFPSLWTGVVSANDMTLEAVACKLGYLFGRGDLSIDEVVKLMPVSLRGEGR